MIHKLVLENSKGVEFVMYSYGTLCKRRVYISRVNALLKVIFIVSTFKDVVLIVFILFSNVSILYKQFV